MQTGLKVMSDKVTATSSYVTAGATTAGGLLSLSEWAIVIGILATVATFGLNYWVQTRNLRMAEREHQARMAQLEKGKP
jgi:hypothetical protein